MTAITQAAFAKHIGKKPSYVKLLKDFGRLVMDGDKVNLEESLELIEATRDPSKQGVADRHQAAREQKQAQSEAAPTESTRPAHETEFKDASGSKYQHAKAMREQYNALQAKIAYEKEIKLLLPVADVKSAVADGDTLIRNRLEALPDILAPQLAAERDEQKIRMILMDYIEQTLSDLSRSFNQLAQ